MNKTLSERFANISLWAISVVGTYLVSEQWISGESLTEIQGVVGLALGGGGLSILTIFNLIKGLAPAVAKKTLEQVGVEKVNNFFDKLDNVFAYIQQVDEKLNLVLSKLSEAEEQKELIKQELGL